jgi:hypothetical protein
LSQTQPVPGPEGAQRTVPLTWKYIGFIMGENGKINENQL